MGSSDKNQSRQTITAKEGSTISNIVQAVINLPAWAWITGMLTLSLCLCIAIISASVVANSNTLFPKSTPMAFNTATPEESLIIVANFEDRSNGTYTGLDHAQYIYEQLDAQVKKDKLNITVRRLDQVVDDNTAKTIGEAYHATLVIWGWYDTLTVTPRIERIKNLQGRISDMESYRVSLTNPGNVEFETITDLPNQVSYLIMFTLAADSNINSKYDTALIYINNAIQIASADSNDATDPNEAYAYRGLIYSNNEEYEKALADVNKIIELDPNYAFAYFVHGVIYAAKEEFDKAIAEYTHAIELEPDYANAYYNRGSAYYSKGESLQSMGNESGAKENYGLALVDFSKGLDINPNDTDFYYMRGLTYESINSYDDAITEYTKAIQLDSNYAYAYQGRGNNYQYKGDYESAIADFTTLIQLMPDYAPAYSNRGNNYLFQGKYDLAISDYNKSIELNPENSFAYNGRGYAYYNKGDYDNAMADYFKAIEFDPKNSIAYFNRGSLFLDNKDYNHAIADFDKVIELTPDRIFAYYNRGLAYEYLGQTNDAIKDFQKVLEISKNPDLRKKAEEELKKLKGN